jgi:hypothetical protein
MYLISTFFPELLSRPLLGTLPPYRVNRGCRAEQSGSDDAAQRAIRECLRVSVERRQVASE